ncbi:unnamed protein product [Effrenium voratum]|nr:unnamed protein product [Effrenium voratum]
MRLAFLSLAAAAAAARFERNGPPGSDAARDFHCPCGTMALESQLARMVATSYDDKGIRSLESYAKDIFSCYSWSDFYYKLESRGIVSAVLAKVKWTEPIALVGRCAMKPATCTLAFSGAANLNFVAGIMDYKPVNLRRNSSGSLEAVKEFTAGSHRFHRFYWEVYEDFRAQVGSKVVEALQGCEHVTITGHSIGAALAAAFQWEHLERNMQQITVGQNTAWFGAPPDVGCRGKRLYKEDDPVPWLRQFWSGGDVVRHALVPGQMLASPRLGHQAWFAEPLGSCEANEPMDPACVDGCSPLGPHYNLKIGLGIGAHQASAYIAATDSAFNMSKLSHEAERATSE